MSLSVIELRRQARQLRRRIRDLPLRDRMVRAEARPVQLPEQLCLQQELRPSESLAAKRHNIRLATARLNDRPFAPGQILSFWTLVGRSTTNRGYRAGRSLLGGELKLDQGGGLCQLAGGLYHLALLSGLDIHERWPHSVDLYSEDQRYTPLGADAAVAWGFKDLRLTNQLSQTVAFRVTLTADRVHFGLHAAAPIEAWTLDFERRGDTGDRREVEVSRHRREQSQRIGRSSYRFVGIPTF